MSMVGPAALGIALARLTRSIGPPIAPSELVPWLESREPVDIAFAALRVVALGITAYVIVVSALALAASVLCMPRLVHAGRAITVPALRCALKSVAGMSMTSGALTANLVPGAPPSAQADVSAARLGTFESDVEDAGTATMQLLEPPAPRDERQATWHVERGDHMWQIATDVLHEAWHRTPSDAEVVWYWRQLIEANRSRLLDEHNADLILVGQELLLPPV
jgi:hypothetical protein